MKKIFRILIILAVFALSAWGVYWLGESTTLFSSMNTESRFEEGGRPDFDQNSGSRPTERGEGEFQERGRGGDHHDDEGIDVARGLSQVGSALVKIGIITLAVLLIQKMLVWLKKRPFMKVAQ